eukprot:COSAG01_NODE_39_length_33243_cov_28.298558_23_plen_68_part_00
MTKARRSQWNGSHCTTTTALALEEMTTQQAQERAFARASHSTGTVVRSLQPALTATQRGAGYGDDRD